MVCPACLVNRNGPASYCTVSDTVPCCITFPEVPVTVMVYVPGVVPELPLPPPPLLPPPHPSAPVTAESNTSIPRMLEHFLLPTWTQANKTHVRITHQLGTVLITVSDGGKAPADNLKGTTSRRQSICGRRHPSHAVHAFREPNGLFHLPVFKIQDLDGTALGAGYIGVYAV
jgi:hypothetical protein